MLAEIGKFLILFGAFLLVLGLILTFAPSLRLGRLPGDIHIERENWDLYIPVTTCIFLSLLISVIFWILSFLRR